MLEQYDVSFSANNVEAAKILIDLFIQENLCQVFLQYHYSLDFTGFFSIIKVIYDDVSYQLSKLQSFKSEDPDQCHPFVLKKIMFDKSLDEGVLLEISYCCYCT